jgi:hypothetical protein
MAVITVFRAEWAPQPLELEEEEKASKDANGFLALQVICVAIRLLGAQLFLSVETPSL